MGGLGWFPVWRNEIIYEIISLPLNRGNFQLWRLSSESLAALVPNLGSEQKHGQACLTQSCSHQPHEMILWPFSSVMYFWPLKPMDIITKQWFSGSLCCNPSLWVNVLIYLLMILLSFFHHPQIPPLVLVPYQLTWDTYPLSLLTGMKSRCHCVLELPWEGT